MCRASCHCVANGTIAQSSLPIFVVVDKSGAANWDGNWELEVTVMQAQTLTLIRAHSPHLNLQTYLGELPTFYQGSITEIFLIFGTVIYLGKASFLLGCVLLCKKRGCETAVNQPPKHLS